jgi:hypothetical protein
VKESPGPLTYKEGDSLSSSAKYQLSHHRGNGTRGFTHSLRSNFTDVIRKKQKLYPGPGFYDNPTEFGVYGDSKYYKNLRRFKSAMLKNE